MANGKDVRARVILECTSCIQNGVNKESPGISSYITQKNRHNTPSRLDLRKFCRYCHKHTIHEKNKEMARTEHMCMIFQIKRGGKGKT